MLDLFHSLTCSIRHEPNVMTVDRSVAKKITVGGTSAVVAGGASLALAVVLAGWAGPATGASCRVPAALLCAGCAEQLTLRLDADGTCRISFKSVAPTNVAASAAESSVDINIEAKKLAKPGTVAKRPRSSHAAESAPAAIGRSALAYTTCGRNGCQFVPAGCVAIPHTGGHGLGGRIFC
jgi:hypothetical protein